ncbi:MAG TPA: hypothetical protein VLG38_02790 [Gammaproteobacteria bacterium]|nr:hypothetical protein [Gammaproteobacteria bacterium]
MPKRLDNRSDGKSVHTAPITISSATWQPEYPQPPLRNSSGEDTNMPDMPLATSPVPLIFSSAVARARLFYDEASKSPMLTLESYSELTRLAAKSLDEIYDGDDDLYSVADNVRTTYSVRDANDKDDAFSVKALEFEHSEDEDQTISEPAVTQALLLPPAKRLRPASA